MVYHSAAPPDLTDLEPDDVLGISEDWEWKLETANLSCEPIIIIASLINIGMNVSIPFRSRPRSTVQHGAQHGVEHDA